MPYKLLNDRRHKFKKARYKINNWPDYNEALKQRGNITLWFSEEAISLWYPKKVLSRTRGAQIKYSDIAIETGLIIKSVYHFLISNNNCNAIPRTIPTLKQHCQMFLD